VMKKILFLALFLAFCQAGFAQRTAQIGISSGIVNYIGDLGHEKYFPYSSANFGTAVTIRDFINNPRRSGMRYRDFDMQLRFTWHRLQYDEVMPIGGRKGLDLRNYRRGIGFRNDLFGAEVNFTYNVFINKFAPLTKPKLGFFLLAGAGMFYGEPKADLFFGNPSPESRYHYWSDGTIRNTAENSQGIGNEIRKDGEYETNLRDWLTEGQGFSREIHTRKPYSNFNVGFPFGGGIRYIYNQSWTFSAEFNYYFFLTDYLDDVSDQYATYDELKAAFTDPVTFELAKYISDPSGHGTSGIQATASRRGNPDQRDSFTYLSVEAAYKFTWKKKGIYGQ
jgi:hypothetical protein